MCTLTTILQLTLHVVELEGKGKHSSKSESTSWDIGH